MGNRFNEVRYLNSIAYTLSGYVNFSLITGIPFGKAVLRIGLRLSYSRNIPHYVQVKSCSTADRDQAIHNECQDLWLNRLWPTLRQLVNKPTWTPCWSLIRHQLFFRGIDFFLMTYVHSNFSSAWRESPGHKRNLFSNTCDCIVHSTYKVHSTYSQTSIYRLSM